MYHLINDSKPSLLNYQKPQKQKSSFTIDALVGKDDRTPSPEIERNHSSDATITGRLAHERTTPQYIESRRSNEFSDIPSNFLEGCTLPPFICRKPDIDYALHAGTGYLYPRTYDSLVHSHMQVPLPVMLGRESNYSYPWLMNRHFRNFPHKFQGADHPAFLYNPFRKPKRIRTAFSPSQLLQLEHAFEKNHYVVGTERRALAQSLRLSETQVKVWFQNRRTKYKRQKQDDQGGDAKNKDYFDSRDPSSSSGDEDSPIEESSPSPPDVGHSTPLSSCSSSTMAKDSIWNPLSLNENVSLNHSMIPIRCSSS